MKAICLLSRTLPYCALLLFAGAGNAQIQGSLFTEPDERVYLDFLREEFLRNSAEQGFDIEEVEIPEIPEDAAVTDPGVSTYSFGGILMRRDGLRSIWLNGALITESRLPEGFSLIENGSGVSLRANLEGATYQLLPGQTLTMPAGTVVETQRILMPAQNSAPSLPVEVAAPVEASSATTQLLESEPATPPAVASGSESQVANGASVSPEALESSVSEMSDSEIDALFEIIESRRLERESGSDDAR